MTEIRCKTALKHALYCQLQYLWILLKMGVSADAEEISANRCCALLR